MSGLGGLRSSGKGAVLGAETSAVWGAVGVGAAPDLHEAKAWRAGTEESALAAALHTESFPVSQDTDQRSIQSTGPEFLCICWA